MELAVYNLKGEDTGRKVTLSDAIFGLEPNEHVMYLDVKQYLANQRQGTHKSKQRNEVHGTTKKLKKQKGTGGARAGSMKSGVFVGGGRMGNDRVKVQNLKVMRVVGDKNLILVSGSIPGAKNSYVVIEK